MRLTKANIPKIVLPTSKSEFLVFDDALPGFGLRLRAGGKRTWIAQYRLGTKQRRITLGTVETVDPDEARRRARDVLSKAHLGYDAQSQKAEIRAQASTTVGAVADRYLADYASKRLKPRSLVEVKRHLENHWKPLAQRPVATLTRAAIAARLTEISKQNGPFAANRARAALSAMYSWAIGEGLSDANPVTGTHKATDEIKRDRVLTDQELALVWRHAGPGDFGAIARLLILTAARREEIGGSLWDEVQNGSLRIGADRSKNGLANDLPLSPQALQILNSLPRSDERLLLFGSGAGPFSGWSRAKAALDARIVEAMKVEQPKATLTPWRLHDLRRTAATRMGDLGVQPHIVEAVLGHISGSKGGVAGIYNRSTYLPEKRAALALWGVRVAELVGGGND